MNTDCTNCKHARLWNDAEQYAYIKNIFESLHRMPSRIDHYFCDKIPEGATWYDAEFDKEFNYDGFSLEGENYDEVFHCFEPRES